MIAHEENLGPQNMLIWNTLTHLEKKPKLGKIPNISYRSVALN